MNQLKKSRESCQQNATKMVGLRTFEDMDKVHSDMSDPCGTSGIREPCENCKSTESSRPCEASEPCKASEPSKTSQPIGRSK